MLFADLWDRWVSPDEIVVESCTILTTSSNELVSPLHDRLPAILSMDIDRWLDSRSTDPAELKTLLTPYPSEFMQLYPVSNMVNSPKNYDVRCIEPT